MITKLFSRHRFIAQGVISRRTFCEASNTCWNCSVSLGNKVQIFCLKCEAIQSPPQVDYFGLFGLQRDDPIDKHALTTKFRSYQSLIHPDKFSGKSDKEQKLSSGWSSLINEAYKTLKSPLERGVYLLSLQSPLEHGEDLMKQRNVTLPEENTIEDPEFLSEMMERNEEVDEATTKEEIQKILINLRDEMSQLSDTFFAQYKSGSLDEARASLIKMKYLASIEKSIKGKLLRS